MSDPVESLKAVVTLAEERRKLGDLLTSVRTIEESDEMTLKRLLDERRFVVRLLQDHPEAKHHHSGFDFEYKENFCSVVERYMKPK